MLKTKTRSAVMLLIFVLPALVLYSVIVLFPASGGVFYSLTNWNGLNPNYRMVGLENYIEAFTSDRAFIQSLLFTLKYVAVMVVAQNCIALLLAVLIDTQRRSRTLFRTIFFMPNMISMIIGGFMWLFIFTKVIPAIAEVPILSFLDKDWIGNPDYSFFSIIILSLWAQAGYLMVIYIAALQGVPAQLLEAAEIDGATNVQRFFRVTLPSIAPAVTICIFISLNTSFKVFEAVYALTGGGPGRATQVIALNIFEEAFNMNNRYGYASAKAIILFLIVFVITLVQLLVMNKRGEE